MYGVIDNNTTNYYNNDITSKKYHWDNLVYHKLFLWPALDPTKTLLDLGGLDKVQNLASKRNVIFKYLNSTFNTVRCLHLTAHCRYLHLVLQILNMQTLFLSKINDKVFVKKKRVRTQKTTLLPCNLTAIYKL